LSPSELCNAATVSKQWAEFARDETLWKDHYTQFWMPLEKFPSEPSWKSMFLRRLASVTRRIWRYKCRYSNILLLGDAKTGKTSYMNGVFEERARNYNNEKVADPEKKMYKKALAAAFETKLRFNFQYVDTEFTEETNEEQMKKIRDSYLQCDLILLFYAMDNAQSLQRLRDYWAIEVRRYCQFEIPVIVVGTKSDVVLALTEEMNATLAFLKTHYEYEGSMTCSPTTPSGCNEIIDVADSVMLYPLVSIQSRQNGYLPYVRDFMTSIFLFYDKDGDNMLNATECMQFYNDLFGTDHEDSYYQAVQNEITALNPQYLVDGKVTLDGYRQLLEREGRAFKASIIWLFLRSHGFLEFYYNKQYPSGVLKKEYVMPTVSVPGSAAVTSFDDMITMVLTHEDDPEVLKWVASSYFCASNSEDLRAMIMDYPDSIHVLGLILNADYVSPETWHMAVGTLLDFANDEKFKADVLERDYFAPRSLELLRREKDPLLTGTLIRFLTTLARLSSDIQDLLISEGVDQLFIEYTKHEYTDVQYSMANLFYRCMVHENIVHVLTDEIFDTMSDLMSSPLLGIREAGFTLVAYAHSRTQMINLLFEDGREPLMEKFLDTAREIPLSFFHAAVAYLVAYNPKYYDLIIEKDGVGTLTTLMGQILKLDFSAKLVSEVIDGYVVMLEHEEFNEEIDKYAEEWIENAMLLAVGYAEYYNILVFAFALLIEKGHGEVFIEKFGNALRTGNKMGLYLLVKYVVFVLLIRSPTTEAAEFLESLAPRVINQALASKRDKIAVHLVDVIGYLAADSQYRSVIDAEEASNMIAEIVAANQLRDEPAKFALAWAHDRVDGPPKRSGELTFTEDYSTVMTQISADGYTVRGHYGTVFLPLGVTKGKWYYEVTLKTAGSMEVGWASSNTIERYNTFVRTGYAEDDFSYAVDLSVQTACHGGSKPYGPKWKIGDVIGCFIDLDSPRGKILFSVNGKSCGLAFENIQAQEGFFPAVSLAEAQQLQLNIGQEPFKYTPPSADGYLPFINATSSPHTKKPGKVLRAHTAPVALRSARTKLVARQGRMKKIAIYGLIATLGVSVVAGGLYVLWRQRQKTK
jgi:hypothetical protein